MEAPPAGEYTVRVEKGGFTMSEAAVTVSAGQGSVLDFALTPEA